MGAYEDLHRLDDSPQKVPGAITATNSRTGQIVVLKEEPDISATYRKIQTLGSSSPRPPDLTVEQLQALL